MRFRLPFLLSIVFCLYSEVGAQPVPIDTLHKYGIYDTDRLTPEFHRSRRDEFRSHMAEHSAALFLAAPEKIRANDVYYEYHQDPNFYYLTGHVQPDAALLITKQAILVDGQLTHEILFVQKREPSHEVWTGPRLGAEGAKSVLKFQVALENDSLKRLLTIILQSIDTLYYNQVSLRSFSDPALDTTWNPGKDLFNGIKSKYPKVELVQPQTYLSEMRSIKQDEELRLMRKAITVSNTAHNEIIRTARPGLYEYQLQALGEYIFTRNGCEYTGYPCIVGSGNNSTILHYETNRRKTEPGDFIEMDIGAEYHGYSADVTRSFPISGKFTPEQRLIYDLVLEAQDSGIAEAQVGKDFKAPHRAAVSVITRGLLKLGIITKPEDYKKYFMHGTSHYLGLDVHDAGNSLKPLQDRQVITVEPGIYISEGSPCDKKWWKIGCRIEDDILITPQGPEILSKNSP
ncbi:MAG: aminopeptidase P N-terminal domain-containing protein, partial [Bacteroidota bacterium]|nr:aminopeptidase P N-terminal domain-containing protein [Bacteroidota bacterium]